MAKIKKAFYVADLPFIVLLKYRKWVECHKENSRSLLVKKPAFERVRKLALIS